MGIRVSPGFTIIEVMLFLAITGLMMAGILASASSSLNSQRYLDGVEAIRSLISSEYAKVYSLTNSRDRSDPCLGIPATDDVWGTSDCLYAGRLVEVRELGGAANEHALVVRPVVAKEKPGISSDELFERFDFTATSEDELMESRPFDWGLSAVAPAPGDRGSRVKVAFLILRSPLDGAVTTYNLLAGDPLREVSDDNLNLDLLGRSETLTTPVEFCVADLDGPLDPSTRQAIVISERATSAADVETRFGDGTGDNPTC